MDTVGSNASACLRIFEVTEVLHLVGDEIEPVDIADVGVLDPDLVIDARTLDCEVAELTAIRIPFLWRLPYLELLGLLIELRDGALVHYADPGVIVFIEFEVKRAFRPSRLNDWDRILRQLSRLRIHFAEKHLTEVGVPDIACAIEHDVVWLNQSIR